MFYRRTRNSPAPHCPPFTLVHARKPINNSLLIFITAGNNLPFLLPASSTGGLVWERERTTGKITAGPAQCRRWRADSVAAWPGFTASQARVRFRSDRSVVCSTALAATENCGSTEKLQISFVGVTISDPSQAAGRGWKYPVGTNVSSLSLYRSGQILDQFYRFLTTIPPSSRRLVSNVVDVSNQALRPISEL